MAAPSKLHNTITSPESVSESDVHTVDAATCTKASHHNIRSSRPQKTNLVFSTSHFSSFLANSATKSTSSLSAAPGNHFHPLPMDPTGTAGLVQFSYFLTNKSITKLFPSSTAIPAAPSQSHDPATR
ncbi:MAG: hypothetical protein M1836_005484 [Candelina mexicana]|nr:MAG: hypothetical protein M1836_005484 [Candelina mexicana]